MPKSTMKFLLNAIRDCPSLGEPRLALAEFLEERRSVRGRLMRLQCELKRLCPADAAPAGIEAQVADLMARHRSTLVGPLAEVAEESRLELGFLHLTLAAHMLSSRTVVNSKQSRWIHSLKLLHLTEDRCGQLFTWPHLGRLLCLDASDNPIGDVLASGLATAR